jgi:hypothetical protein
MAVNKPVGDNARKGAVKKRTQLKNKLTGTSTKRNNRLGTAAAPRRGRCNRDPLPKPNAARSYGRCLRIEIDQRGALATHAQF